MTKTQTNNSRLRALPSIDSLLQTETAKALAPKAGVEHLTSLARQVTDQLRQDILSDAPAPNEGNGSRSALLREAEGRLASAYESEIGRGLRRVINATGVVLHTNLGRAPLSEAARAAIAAAAGYCSLEYDVRAGARGRRGARAEDLLTALTGAEGALVVNNCAAAALLALTTLARDGETIVSRGELVEIGGDFRVPDVMAQSGTRMIEVGTTNRTRLADYRKAITESTRLMMRVHTSNYRIVGFTKTPSLSELAELAHSARLPLYEDAGSGALQDFKRCGIDGEPVIRESIAAGADVVTFSGDKLLGGPQAGLIVGRAELIERMRKHPLYRALRVDKLCLAALEATLQAYSRGENTSVQKMLNLSAAEIGARAKELIGRIGRAIPSTMRLEVIDGESAVGGGSAPTSPLPTKLISISDSSLSANEIETRLRSQEPPMLVRIVEDRVAIDLRTVSTADEAELERALKSLA
jgi:L-seryl-tRNA(Ser) seleniumtransferase